MNLLFGNSTVGTCRLRAVDKFLQYSGTSREDPVQTFCQSTVLGSLTMDHWRLSHYVLLPVPVLFIPLGVGEDASLSCFRSWYPFLFAVSGSFLPRSVRNQVSYLLNHFLSVAAVPARTTVYAHLFEEGGYTAAYLIRCNLFTLSSGPGPRSHSRDVLTHGFEKFVSVVSAIFDRLHWFYTSDFVPFHARCCF